MTETYFNYRKYSVGSEKQNQRNLDSKKVILNIFHKYNLAFALFLLVVAIWYCPSFCCFIGITLEHVGYRQRTEIISLKYGVNISKEHVRKALVDIDPEVVSVRKKKAIKRKTYETNGSFDVFHIDGNDNLKRFAFAIHGCIDGFSRKLIWLFVSTKNNDPLVAANFYLKAITISGRAPNTLRMDLGTENVYCEELQVFFTKNSNSFLYVASIRNQRIEAFWSRLRKFNLSWWIDFCSDLIKCRIFNPGCQFHREALIFSFMPVIRAQLNDFVRIWNIREIRQSSTSLGCVPEILFNVHLQLDLTRKDTL